jgi:hypothetical protein
VWPAGAAQPLASNLDFVRGDVAANLVEVRLGALGRVSVGVGPAGSATAVVVDVEGYTSSVPGGALFRPLPPSRIADTRCGASSTPAYCSGENLPADNAGLTKLSAGSPATVHVEGNGGVPSSGVEAVALNVTAVGGDGAEYVTVYPGGTPPVVSNLNTLAAGQVVPNRVLVPLASDGTISVVSNHATNVIVDVSGYFEDGISGSHFHAVATPARVCDTRADQAVGGSSDVVGGVSGKCANSGQALGAGGAMAAKVNGLADVPSGATAVVLNVTATDTSASSYITAYPNGQGRPTASDLNWSKGQTTSNLVVVEAGIGGTIDLYNYAGSVDVVVDVEGYDT